MLYLLRSKLNAVTVIFQTNGAMITFQLSSVNFYLSFIVVVVVVHMK